jgi:hypothetical protein
MSAAGAEGRAVWIAAGNDEWVPGVVVAENVSANVAGRTDMRGQPLEGQKLTACLLPDTGDQVTVPESTLRPRDPVGGDESLGAGLLGGGGATPTKGGLLGGAKAKAAAIQARIASPQQQQQQQQRQPQPLRPAGSTGVPGEIRAVREEAVLTITTADGQEEVNATVAAFGERVARLSNVPLVRAYPPLADAQLSNPHEIRGAVAVIARGGVPFVEKARRAQAADAVGVIFINDADEPYVALGMDGDSDIVLPVVCVRRSDGAAICEKITLSKGVRHHCTASLSFGNSTAVSNELESFLRNPAGAENIRVAAKKAGRAIASAGEAARGGLKAPSPGSSEYQAAPSGASGPTGASPPRSSAAIVGEWISSRKPSQKASGKGGLSMGLQLVDDSIYNQPTPSAPSPAPAPVLAPAPVPAPVPTIAPAAPAAVQQTDGATQQTLTKLLSQHVASTPKNAASSNQNVVVDSTAASSAAAASDTRAAAQLQALQAATENAAAAAEASAQLMQQRHEIELKEVRETAARELQRVTEGARVAIAASNARLEAERDAHQKTTSTLQLEKDSHQGTRTQLTAAASTQLQVQQLERENANSQQQVVSLQGQLQQARSLSLELERTRDLQSDELSSNLGHVAEAVSRAVAEANETWEAKMQTVRRGFEFDLQEAEKQVETYKIELAHSANAVAAAVSKAVVDAESAAIAKHDSISRELTNTQSDMEAERTKFKQHLAALTTELDDMRKAEPASQMGRVCADCGEELPRDSFSGTQWKRGTGASRCAGCVEASPQKPSATGAAAGLSDARIAAEVQAAVHAANQLSATKLVDVESTFKVRLADMQMQATREVEDAERRLAEVTLELTQMQQRDVSAEIQRAVDYAAREKVAALEAMRQSWQAKLDSAEVQAAAERQSAESSTAEAIATAERTKAELSAGLVVSESNQQVKLQQAVDEAKTAADVKLQTMQKAYQCDLDEAIQTERNLRSELAAIQSAEAESSGEFAQLQHLIKEKDLALQAAIQAGDAKLQAAVRDVESSREESEASASRLLADMTESHQAAAQANLALTVRTMQKQVDDATATSHTLELQLRQVQTEFHGERSQWRAREDSLSKELASTAAQQKEMGEQLVESEQLVTEMSEELERVQSEQSHDSVNVDDAAARLESARKAFDVDFKASEASAADKLERVKEAARQKLEEVVEARREAEAMLQNATQEHSEARRQAEESQQTIAKMTAELSQAETALSERSFEHNQAHRDLSDAQQQVADIRNELTKCQAELEAERVASETNQAVRDKVSDEMALALEAAHLKSDAKVQDAHHAFLQELEEARADASRGLSVANQEAENKILAAQQHAAESQTLREEAETALQAVEKEHSATKMKLLGYLDGQDRALELESQVEQLEAELVETARQLGVKDDHHESLLERTRTGHAEALKGLEAKLESLGQAKSDAERSAENSQARVEMSEQERSRAVAQEQNLRSELQQATESHHKLKSEMEQQATPDNQNVEVAALQQKLDRLATELEQSQNELFHTAEEAVATELALKSELDGIRVSREQAESKLAATVSEHEATVAQAQAAQQECARLRDAQESTPVVEHRKDSAVLVAAIEAEKSQLETSVERLSRQLRLVTAEKEMLAQKLDGMDKLAPARVDSALQSTGDPATTPMATSTSSTRSLATGKSPVSSEVSQTTSPHDLKVENDHVVAGLQSEMEYLRSQLGHRANENQSLQQQIHQLQQSHAQLVDGQSRGTQHMVSPTAQSQPQSVAAMMLPTLPATPERISAAAAAAATATATAVDRSSPPQLGSPVRDHAAELETLEVMVHALRQEASAASTPVHSDRAASSRSGSPLVTSRPGSPMSTRSGMWPTDASSADLPSSHSMQDFEHVDNEHGVYGAPPDSVVDAPRRLCEAVASGAGAVVKMLVHDQRGANALWDRADGATLLHAAAFNGHAHVAAHLLALDADVDRPMVNGATPVFAAAQQGHVDVLDELLAAGATVNWVSDDGSTPLYVAAWKGHAAVVSRLLSYGAHADRYHRERATPLFVAAQEGHAAVVRVLLGAGADPRRPWQDAHGRRWSAMDKAMANRHSAVVTILRDAQAQRSASGRRQSLSNRSVGSPHQVGVPRDSPRRPSPVRRHRSSRQGMPKPESNGWR